MKQIPVYKFYRHKYGSELLIDVLDLDALKEGIRRAPVHCETFYQIVLFTAEENEAGINGHRRRATPGLVACGRPGEVWEWRAETPLKGDVLIFEEPFLLSFFNDAHFLDRLSYLQADRPSPFLLPDAPLQKRLRQLFLQMKEEMAAPQHKDQHILRAMLYEFLMLLDRAKNAAPRTLPPTGMTPDRYRERFVRLADREFREHHDVEYYAGQLCITANYLNRLVSGHLGVTTKQYLNRRLVDEAKRLLAYTTLSVNEITDLLHFESSAYFVRFFHKAVGLSPAQYRKDATASR